MLRTIPTETLTSPDFLYPEMDVYPLSPILKELLNGFAGYAQSQPDRIAVIDRDRSITYSQLHGKIRDFKSAFCTKEPRVMAVLAGNSLETAYVLLGSMAIKNATLAVIPPHLTQEQVSLALQTIQPDIIFFDADLCEKLPLKVPSKRVLLDESFLANITDRNHAQSELQFSPKDMGMAKIIMPTSGTTGMPKFVPFALKRLLSIVDSSIAADHAVISSHISWISGLYQTFYSSAHGKTIVYIGKYEFQKYLDAVIKYEPAIVLWPAFLMNEIIHLPDETIQELNSTVQLITYGGSRMPLAVLEKALQLFPGTAFMNVYGLTEVEFVSVLEPQYYRLHSDLIESAGKLRPGYKLRVLNDDMADVAEGVSGEIFVSYPLMFRGYHHNVEASRAVLFADAADGTLWYKTGDVGKIDKKGFLFVEGRRGSEIVTLHNTRLIISADVENAILGFPGLYEVKVYGDHSGDEMVHLYAAVVAHELVDTDALLKHLEEILPMEAIPSVVWQLPDGKELPRNPNGKIDLGSLKLLYRNKY